MLADRDSDFTSSVSRLCLNLNIAFTDTTGSFQIRLILPQTCQQHPPNDTLKTGRKKPPYLKPPARPLLTSLPPALLHNIFGHLKLMDFLASRLTCSLMATIGLDRFGDKVPLIFKREKLQALTEIAKHPTLAKRIRSLWSTFKSLREAGFEEWYSKRTTPSADKNWRVFRMETATSVQHATSGLACGQGKKP